MARQVGVCGLADEPGLLYHCRQYVVAEPVPFSLLRRWVAGNAVVQEAVARVESLRCRGGVKKRPPTHEEIAGSARAALLLGKGCDFRQCYKEYIRESGGGWHPDPEHFMFWDWVLGPGWEGAEAVPEGPARDELAVLCADAFAFSPLPEGGVCGAGACGAPEGETLLEVAAALRVADAAALEKLSRAGSPEARAAGELLAGKGAAAQARFEEILGRAEDNRYRLVRQHGMPLIIYALVSGVLAGGSPRFLRAWLSYARYMIPYIYAPSMSRREGEMMRFLNNLELVDSLVNRNGSMALEPELRYALSHLPFAMVYGSLPAYVRRQVKAETLAEAVESLSAAGMRLLAHYGAAGLLQAGELSPRWRQRMEALLLEMDKGVGRTLPAPSTQRALADLRELVHKHARQGYLPLQVPDALTPVLAASRTAEGVLISLDGWAYPGDTPDSDALRCLQKYATNGEVALEGASPVEFTRLFVSLQPQVDIVGNLALPGEPVENAAPQPVLLLAHLNGGNCLASLRLRLWPGATPFMTPGCGLELPVLEGADGVPLALRRNIRDEWRLVEKTTRALQRGGLVEAGRLAHGTLSINGFAALAELLGLCRKLGLEVCWERDHALRLHQPQGGLSLRMGQRDAAWLELGGGLPVDEGRVLELSTLLKGFARREGNVLGLEDGEYVLLNPALERQLALLELVWQEKRGRQGLSAAALPLLDALDAAAAPAAEPAAPPTRLQATLRPYQLAGFRWLAERAEMGLGALLADDMGLGKTVQVLACLLHAAQLPGAGAALVVAPVSLLANWAEEAARFAPSLQVITYEPKKADALVNAAAGTLVLASYGQISSRQEDFAALAWDVLVLDEAQAIKNPDSQRARAVCSLTARCRFCLTGTPIENSQLELWTQMRFLNHGLLGTRAAFQRRFGKAKAGEHALLRQVLAPLVLRRTKAEVLTQLPPLTESTEWVEFSREERALYESLRRAAVKKLGQGCDGSSAGVGILAELTRLRRACCHGKLVLDGFAGGSAKLAAMTERVEELRAAGRRVLIFSQFTDVLDLAGEALHERGVTCLRLDGGTPARQRQAAVKSFQQGGADAFLISLKAGGAGLNLTTADYVMLLDPWWNPAVEAQAAGRAHRMGQGQPVTLCRFMVRGTVEERILELHKEKRELAEHILSGTGPALSIKALRELLKPGA